MHSTRLNIYHVLCSSDDENGTEYSDNDILGESVLMMMAGSDTNLSPLTATMFYLVQHPLALEELQADLGATLPIVSSIQPTAAESHRYLQACIGDQNAWLHTKALDPICSQWHQ